MATKKPKKNLHEMHPLIGKEIPAVTLPNQDGKKIAVKAYSKKNSPLVLYFYPKDMTPGCTTQACDFRDNFNRAKKRGIHILGVSADSQERHQKFIAKHDLNFDLLADENKELCKALKVWQKKKFMGLEFMGIVRSTFVVHKGKIVAVWQPVKVKGHADEVLDYVEALK